MIQILAWRRPGDKPLSEPMIVSLLTHICVTRPQWVKTFCSWIWIRFLWCTIFQNGKQNFMGLSNLCLENIDGLFWYVLPGTEPWPRRVYVFRDSVTTNCHREALGTQHHNKTSCEGTGHCIDVPLTIQSEKKYCIGNKWLMKLQEFTLMCPFWKDWQYAIVFGTCDALNARCLLVILNNATTLARILALSLSSHPKFCQAVQNLSGSTPWRVMARYQQDVCCYNVE